MRCKEELPSPPQNGPFIRRRGNTASTLAIIEKRKWIRILSPFALTGLAIVILTPHEFVRGSRLEDSKIHINGQQNTRNMFVVRLLYDPERDVTPRPLDPRPPTAAPTNQPSQRPIAESSSVPTRQPADGLTSNTPTVIPTRKLASESPTFFTMSEPISTTIPSLTPTVISIDPVAESLAPASLSPISMPPSTSTLPSLHPTMTEILLSERPVSVTVSPTLQPTRSPQMVPIQLPPVTSPQTQTPTSIPTSENIDRKDPSTVVPVTVPIDFTADLTPSDNESVINDEDLKQVELVWETALYFYFRSGYREQPGVEFLGVNLLVEQQDRQRFVRARYLQQSMMTRDSRTITIRTQGQAEFRLDTQMVEDPKAFANQVGENLDQVLTETDILQRSLVNAAGDQPAPIVSMVEAASSSVNEERSSSSRPSKAEIVTGFTLLFITLLTLVWWGRVLWKKRQKKLKRKRLEEMRRSQSVLMFPPEASLRTPRRDQVGQSNSKMQVQPTQSLESMSTYKGIASASDEDNRHEIDPSCNQSSSSSDPFAVELERAVSLDRAAWQEFQHKKDSLKPTKPAVDALGSLSFGSSSFGIAAVKNVAVYEAPGSQDMGIEVEPRLESGTNASFPYGDENKAGNSYNSAPVILQSNDAVKWTVAGISLAPVAYQAANASKDPHSENDFEPYGDRKDRSLQESWDVDANPIQGHAVPSRFSFLHPLKRQSTEIPEARWSPSSEESPTDGARRESSDVTSVDSRTDFGEDESPGGSLTELTNSMLKEVDEIAEYLKQYERRKADTRSRQRVLHRAQRHQEQKIATDTSSKQNESMNDWDTSFQSESRPIDQANANQESDPIQQNPSHHHENPQEHSRSPKINDFRRITSNETSQTQRSAEQNRSMDTGNSIQYNQLHDSQSVRRRKIESTRSTHHTTPRHVVSVSASLSDSSDSPEAADDSSLRLGISRISVEKPDALSFRNEISQDSAPFNLPSRLSPIQPPSDNDDSFLQQKRKTHPSDLSAASSSVLSSLRQTSSMLDAVPSDEVTPNALQPKEKKRGGAFMNRMNNLGKMKANTSADAMPPVQQIATKRKKGPSPRSQNQTFNKIFSMFEARPHLPIVPPNDAWQYTGSNSGGGIKDSISRGDFEPSPFS